MKIESISQYWAQMLGKIHPDDPKILASTHDHGFNLDFPPPAFIGDILNAPIIILDNNGGFKHESTPAEFADPQSHDAFRRRLSEPQSLNPNAMGVAPYYLGINFSPWLRSGQAAIVNGVAYRSVDGGRGKVAKIAKTLPSALFHQKWLREAVMPLAVRGERLIVVHRWTAWNGAPEVLRGLKHAIFSTSPISSNLTTQEMMEAKAFLAGEPLGSNTSRSFGGVGSGTAQVEQVIRLLANGNPKTGKSRLRFACYRDGITINEYILAVTSVCGAAEALKCRADVKWDIERHLIQLE